MIRHIVLGAALLASSGPALAQSNAIDRRMLEPADLVFERAEAETALKSELFQSILGDEHYDWEVDLDAGLLTFFFDSKTVSAPVQVVGTYNTLDGTFLWGWDHPSVPEGLDEAARRAREFGEAHELALFTARKVECTEEQAWAFTAVALYLTSAQGSYRAPMGTTMVFMTFGTITIEPAG